MTHKHHNHYCTHANIKFCTVCQQPYCVDCGREWFDECKLSHYWWPQPTISPTITSSTGSHLTDDKTYWADTAYVTDHVHKTD